MTLTLGPHTISIVRAGTKQSDYGTATVFDWSQPAMFDISGCSVQPVQAPENMIDRDSVQTRWIAYVPIDGDVRATDRVIYDGATYDVDGDPMRWSFDSLSHQVINLVRSRDEVV
jgi:hypothetical protein